MSGVRVLCVCVFCVVFFYMCDVCVYNTPYNISVDSLSALNCCSLCAVTVYMCTVYIRLKTASFHTAVAINKLND